MVEAVLAGSTVFKRLKTAKGVLENSVKRGFWNSEWYCLGGSGRYVLRYSGMGEEGLENTPGCESRDSGSGFNRSLIDAMKSERQ